MSTVIISNKTKDYIASYIALQSFVIKNCIMLVFFSNYLCQMKIYCFLSIILYLVSNRLFSLSFYGTLYQIQFLHMI